MGDPQPAGREPAGDGAQSVSLDDYFDQLDAAFSNLQPGAPPSDGSDEVDWPADLAAAPAAVDAVTDAATPRRLAPVARAASVAAGPRPSASGSPSQPPLHSARRTCCSPSHPSHPSHLLHPSHPSHRVAHSCTASCHRVPHLLQPVAPIAPVAPSHPLHPLRPLHRPCSPRAYRRSRPSIRSQTCRLPKPRPPRVRGAGDHRRGDRGDRVARAPAHERSRRSRNSDRHRVEDSGTVGTGRNRANQSRRLAGAR